jgi:hypothetical protein
MHMTISGRSTIRASIAAIALIGAGMASGAHAADLASRPYAKAPAMAVAAYDWSGFYIGANGGWGSSHHCWDAVMPNGTLVPDGCHDATGAVLGGQIGYRWQAGAWVFGLEAQGDWANLRGSSVSPTGGADVVTNESRVVGFGLFTGQIGFAVNNALLYVKGGAAVASNRYSATSISRPAFNEIASDRRRSRIRLRTELVRCGRVRSLDPFGSNRPAHKHPSATPPRQRADQPECRSRYAAPELPVRWPLRRAKVGLAGGSGHTASRDV